MKKQDEVLTAHKVVYPGDLTLWETTILEQKRLRIINPGDFPHDQILRGLGIQNSPLIGSFGICDAEEIKERLELVRFFIQNPELANLVKDMAGCADFPTNESGFLDYFNPAEPHNPHWQRVHKLLDSLRQSPYLPSRLKTLVSTLGSSLLLEDDEMKMGVVVADRVTNIAVIEGLVDFAVTFSCKKPKGQEDQKEEDPEKTNRGGLEVECIAAIYDQVHGHRMYSFALTAATKHSYPKWTGKKWLPWNWIGMGKWAKKRVDRKNKEERLKAYRDMVITEASVGLIEDIASGVRGRLNEIKWEGLRLDRYDFRLTVRVYFSYSAKGLMLHIYAIDPELPAPEERFGFAVYDGYDANRQDIIFEAQKKYVVAIREDRRAMRSNVIREEIRNQQPAFFEEKFGVFSPYTDIEHRWFALSNLYQSQMLKDVYEACREHRLFFEKHLSILKNVLDLTRIFQDKASGLGTELVFPQILTNGESLINFDTVMPIQLLSREDVKKLVPISSLPALNGNMIGLTGFNGGGKTVIEETLAAIIYLIQSGLPGLEEVSSCSM